MPTIVMVQPDTCSDPDTRYAGRDKINTATASDPVTYVGPYPNQTDETVIVTWAATTP